MIVTLRHYLIDSWFGRIVAGAIFLAFVAWGSETFFLSGSAAGDSVVLVGDEALTQQKFAEAVGSELQWVQAQGGQKAIAQFKDRANLDALGQGALHNIVMTMALGQYENKVGFRVPNEVVRNRVFSDPQFETNGSFDQKKMDALLNANNLTRDDLISRTRTAEQVQAGLVGFGSSAKYYQPLLKELVKFSTQSYPTTVYRLTPTSTKDLSGAGLSVSDEKRYYANHANQFRSPEYKQVHIVALISANAAKSVKVSDATIEALYNERKRDYDLPERRDISMMTAPDEYLAKQARVALVKGRSVAEAGKIDSHLVPAALSDMRQADFPDPALGKLVFSQAVGVPSAPTKLDSGWVVVLVKAVHKPQFTSLAAAKPALEAELIKYQGPQIVAEQQKKLQDLIARSSSLDGLKVDPAVITWHGQVESNDMFPAQLPKAIIDDLALRADLIKAISTTQVGAPPSLVTVKNGDSYAITVDHVDPAAQLSFEKAQPQVALAMLDEQKHKAVETKAAAILAQLKTGKPVGVVAQSNIQAHVSHWRGDLSQGVAAPAGLPKDIANKVLVAAQDPDAPANIMVADGDGFIVANFDDPVLASPAEQAAATAQLDEKLSTSLNSDIFETLGAGYIASVKLTKFNKTLFNEVLTSAIKGQ